jgi:hypothetical protein
MFPALGEGLGLLHPVAGGVLRRELKFQTCTNNLNNLFLTIPGIFGSPHVCTILLNKYFFRFHRYEIQRDMLLKHAFHTVQAVHKFHAKILLHILKFI